MTRLPQAIRASARLQAPIAVAARLGLSLERSSRSRNTLANFWGEEIWKLSTSARMGRRPDRSTQRLQRRHRRRRSLRRSRPRWSGSQRDFGTLASAVGRGQPLPAHFAGDRPSVQRLRRRASRCRSAPARWGSLASFGAGAKGRDQALVRHFGQQLRRGGRVRQAGPGAGRHRRRRKRRSGLAAFQRPGRALCRRASCATSISIPTSWGHIERSYRPGE